MKVLVIGLNPSRKHGKSKTLKTLYSWLDVLDIPVVSFTNLYGGYEIKHSEKQDHFIRSISKEYDKIICLGDTVSNCLHHMDIDHGYLPHPSGLNRKINDKIYVHEQLELCKNYVRGTNDL